MTLGNKIANYRKQLGITQDALAQKLCVSNQAVSKWESGQCCPDILLLPQLADIFGASIDELFGRGDALSPQETAALPWPNDNTLRVVVYVGHTLLGSSPADADLSFQYEGPALNVDSCVCVCCGDVAGNVSAGADITCGNVGGDTTAGMNVTAKDVGGDVTAGCNVSCNTIAGDAEAGGSVSVRE